MIVIIAEKPSVGRELARIVGATTRADGYMSGNGYAVTWAFGHLVQITTPLSQTPWRRDLLPIMPDQFYLEVGTRTDSKSGKKVPDEGYAHQLEVIRTLFNDAEYIINAGDAGREGELIQRYIYAYVGCTRPVKRLWISSLTDKAIREGLASLHDSSEFDSLYAAGKARNEADWLVGINATRALTVLSGGNGVKSLGRVQTPTLAMVCKRFQEHENFVPQTFWTLRVSSAKDGLPFKASSKDKYTEKDKAEGDMRSLFEGKEMTVRTMEQKDKTIPPPYLHDLTSLQKEANKRYNLSAQTTLDIAQSLYEKKVLTYPRTGSKFIPEDVFATIPSLIANVTQTPSRYAPYAASMAGKTLSKRSVDQTKVTDHHAILPTEVTPTGLGDLEQKVYDLVICRMLEAMSPVCEMQSTVVEFTGGTQDNIPLVAKGSVTKAPGWKAVRMVDGPEGQDEDKPKGKGKGKASDEENKDDQQSLPSFKVGDRVPVLKVECKEDKTKPKPLHTEATLLEAMEHAGRELTDEQLKDALKDVGIGTPATRAGEIEMILSRGYVQRKGKSLIPTPLGLNIYESVKDKYIANVEMTGRWETSLAKIVDGKVSAKAFDESIRRFVVALTSEILEDKDGKGARIGASSPDAMICPKCGAAMTMWDKCVKCTSCGQVYWREVAHKKLSEATMRKLFRDGKTQVLKGFVSAKGNTFDAAIALNTLGLMVFDFSDVPPKTPPPSSSGGGPSDPPSSSQASS